MLTDNINSIKFTEEVYNRYAAVMYGCIYKLVPQQETVNKIFRAVFVEIHKNPDQYNSTTPPIVFLRLASQAAFNYIRNDTQPLDFSITIAKNIKEVKEIKFLNSAILKQFCDTNHSIYNKSIKLKNSFTSIY